MVHYLSEKMTQAFYNQQNVHRSYNCGKRGRELILIWSSYMMIASFHSLFCNKSSKSLTEGVLPQCTRYYLCKHNTRRNELQGSPLFYNIFGGIHQDSQLSAFLDGKKATSRFPGFVTGHCDCWVGMNSTLYRGGFMVYFFSEIHYLSSILQIGSQPIPSIFFVNHISLSILSCDA